jgi:hypothetical protein
MTPHIVFALVLAFVGAVAQSPAPAPQAAQTPAQCLADVRAHVTKRQQELRPMTADASAKLSAERTAMIKDCISKFDAATVAPKDLAGLADLYADANQLDLANAAVARALASPGLGEADRATLLSQSIRLMLREPKGDERNARIEKIVDQLDALSNAVLETKIAAHVSMNGYYRGDDIDAGIIKHSTWLIDTGKTLSPDLRKKYGSSIVSAYVNMAEAYAGQARNDEAVALLRRAPGEWPDIPNVASRTTCSWGRRARRSRRRAGSTCRIFRASRRSTRKARSRCSSSARTGAGPARKAIPASIACARRTNRAASASCWRRSSTATSDPSVT